MWASRSSSPNFSKQLEASTGKINTHHCSGPATKASRKLLTHQHSRSQMHHGMCWNVCRVYPTTWTRLNVSGYPHGFCGKGCLTQRDCSCNIFHRSKVRLFLGAVSACGVSPHFRVNKGKTYETQRENRENWETKGQQREFPLGKRKEQGPAHLRWLHAPACAFFIARAITEARRSECFLSSRSKRGVLKMAWPLWIVLKGPHKERTNF